MHIQKRIFWGFELDRKLSYLSACMHASSNQPTYAANLRAVTSTRCNSIAHLTSEVARLWKLDHSVEDSEILSEPRFVSRFISSIMT